MAWTPPESDSTEVTSWQPPTTDVLHDTTPLAGSDTRTNDVSQAVKGAFGQLLPSAQGLQSFTKGLDVATSLPMRGLRGMGVGAEKAIEGAGLQPSLERASEATKYGYQPKEGEKLGAVAGEMADPRNYFAGEIMKAGASLAKTPLTSLGKQAAKLGESLTAVDDANFMKLAKAPQSVLMADSSTVTGKALQAAKEAAGVSGAEERALALSDGAKKAVYKKVMAQIDAGKEPTVADLLMAKKAGYALGAKDPSAQGLIAKEVSNKINPLIQKIAPDVYDAQQAVHLSKVKEAFLNLLPETSTGKISFWRLIEAATAGHFGGPLALAPFSPLVAGAATAAGGLGAKALMSPIGRYAAGTGLMRLSENPDLQRIKAQMSNQNAQ